MEEIINGESIKEVWITEFAYGEFPSLVENGLYNSGKDSTIPESNMSSPYTGDISNSYRVQDDLPIYESTYVVYGNSGHRNLDTNIHNRAIIWDESDDLFAFVNVNTIDGSTDQQIDYTTSGKSSVAMHNIVSSGDITLSSNSANITHSGSTKLSITPCLNLS